MTMEYVDLKRGTTVEEVFDRIQSIGGKKRRCTPLCHGQPPQAERHCDQKDLPLAPKNEPDLVIS